MRKGFSNVVFLFLFFIKFKKKHINSKFTKQINNKESEMSHELGIPTAHFVII